MSRKHLDFEHFGNKAMQVALMAAENFLELLDSSTIAQV